MHFRQRVAWLLLAIYLLLTAGVLYYMFEISTQLRMFALDHVDRVHTVAASPLRPREQQQLEKKPIVETAPASIVATCVTFLWLTLSHVVDIPLPVLAVLILFVYVQIFCVLWMCTRPEMRWLSSCFWPAQVYIALKSMSESKYRDRRSSPSLAISNGTRTVVVCDEL